MRKRCISCGLICFASDKICKKCGSAELEFALIKDHLPLQESTSNTNPLRLRHYLLNLGLAAFLEFLALLPILLFIGSHGSGKTEFDIKMQKLLFVLHLPTVLVAWLLHQTVHNDFLFLAPLTQFVFWTWLLNLIARKIREKFV